MTSSSNGFLTIIASLSSKNLIKGIIGGLFGLLIATFGMDPQYGYGRFTFGQMGLITGFPTVPTLIGLYSVSQLLTMIVKRNGTVDIGDSLLTLNKYKITLKDFNYALQYGYEHKIIDSKGKSADLIELLKMNFIDGSGDILGAGEYKGVTINAGAGKDNITGSLGNDTINGGDGDDEITAGLGNDNITGGVGKNTITYYIGDGNDTINLTKGENFTLNLPDLNFTDLSFSYTNKNKDLVISYNENDVQGSIILKNFAGSNVTNNANTKTKQEDTSSVELITTDGTTDLRTYLYELKATDNFTGGWLNEYIDASGVNGTLTKTVTVNKKKQTVAKISTDAGFTLNGGNGDDKIVGTMYSDTIKGGNGDDTIIGSKGNDKLYGDAGNNSLFFQEGDGQDTVYMNTKGIDSLVFNKDLDTITYEKSGNNLVIKYGEMGDTVTISKYFSTKNPSVDKIYTGSIDLQGKLVYNKNNYISLKDHIILQGYNGYIDFEIYGETKSVSGKHYDGNSYNNTVESTTKYDLIKTNDGDDFIYMQSQMGYADGGYGDDTYVVKSLANATIIKDEQGDDSLKILDSKNNIKILFDVDRTGTINGDSLCIMNKSTMNKLLSNGTIPIAGIHLNGSNPIERVETKKGKDYEHRRYEPLFDFVKEKINKT